MSKSVFFSLVASGLLAIGVVLFIVFSDGDDEPPSSELNAASSSEDGVSPPPVKSSTGFCDSGSQ